MGVYVAIRGWLQCDDKQLALVHQVIDSDPHPYNDGWAFPAQRINWTGYAFYGADIRDSAVDWFLDQLRRLAALPASDEDNDRVQGLFLVSHEVEGMAQWQVRDGQVHIRTASVEFAYLDG